MKRGQLKKGLRRKGKSTITVLFSKFPFFAVIILLSVQSLYTYRPERRDAVHDGGERQGPPQEASLHHPRAGGRQSLQKRRGTTILSD